MKEELKPCPFCGSKMVEPYLEYNAYRVSCWNCDAEGAPSREREDAVARWNLRSSPALIGLPVIDPSMLEGK